MSSLRSNTGTYVLAMQCAGKQTVEVGAQGPIALQSGTYLYVGSAFGPGGVAARVRRHARRDHRQHWHIDHIRPHCTLQGAWISYSEARLECRWARALLDAERTSVPKKRIGSSDCGCEAHFMRIEIHSPKQHEFIQSQVGAVLQEVCPCTTIEWIKAQQIL